MYPDCKHPNKIPTLRTKANGAECVAIQCPDCGAGCGEESKLKHNLAALPVWDATLRDKWESKYRQASVQDQETRAFEQQERSAQWWADYNTFLKSEHWQQIRAVVLRRDPICQKCFKRPSNEAHHLSYETYNKHGFSFPSECVGICSPCHDSIHPRRLAA